MRAVTLSLAPEETVALPATRRPIPWRLIGAIVCWLLVAAWVGFAIVRLFGLEHTWYVDTFIAFTPYVTVLSVVPLLVALSLRRWRAAGVALRDHADAAHALFVPRAFGSPDPGNGPTLRVMSANLRVGWADPGTIVGLVRSQNIDLLAIQELTPDIYNRLLEDGLGTLLPFDVAQPMPLALGSAIFSRYPLSDHRFRRLSGGFAQEYATVHVPGAQPLLFVSVHTRAPENPTVNTDWAKSIAQEPHATPKGPVRLLAGDFNATLDHARLRTLLGTGYVDIASQLGDGLTTTWPYDDRRLPRITLDHFFADPRIGAVSFGAALVPGSDHRTIYAVVTLPAA